MRMGGSIIDGAIKVIDAAWMAWRKTDDAVKKLVGLRSREEELEIEKEMTEEYDLGRLIQPMISKQSNPFNICVYKRSSSICSCSSKFRGTKFPTERKFSIFSDFFLRTPNFTSKPARGRYATALVASQWSFVLKYSSSPITQKWLSTIKYIYAAIFATIFGKYARSVTLYKKIFWIFYAIF